MAAFRDTPDGEDARDGRRQAWRPGFSPPFSRLKSSRFYLSSLHWSFLGRTTHRCFCSIGSWYHCSNGQTASLPPTKKRSSTSSLAWNSETKGVANERKVETENIIRFSSHDTQEEVSVNFRIVCFIVVFTDQQNTDPS